MFNSVFIIGKIFSFCQTGQSCAFVRIIACKSTSFLLNETSYMKRSRLAGYKCVGQSITHLSFKITVSKKRLDTWKVLFISYHLITKIIRVEMAAKIPILKCEPFSPFRRLKPKCIHQNIHKNRKFSAGLFHRMVHTNLLRLENLNFPYQEP